MTVRAGHYMKVKFGKPMTKVHITTYFHDIRVTRLDKKNLSWQSMQ